MKIALISVGDKANTSANTTVVCCSNSELKGMGNFSFRAVETKM